MILFEQHRLRILLLKRKYGRPLSFQQMLHLTAYLAWSAINKINFFLILMNINCFFLSLLNDYVLKYEINHLLWHLNRFFNKKLETFSCCILEEEDNPVHCTNCLRLPHAERDFNIMPSGRWISIELIKWKSFKP